MEKFKTCEKEMKTKAYSKEGLSQAAKLDPKEKEKAEMGNWLTSAVDRLFTQVNMMEAELEALELGMKKSKKPESSKVQRRDDLEVRIETHKAHMGKLEILLRMLENGTLGVDSLYIFKEDMDYYVESNAEPDFVEDFCMFDDFDLSESQLLSDSEDQSDSESESEDEKDKEESPKIIPVKPAAIQTNSISIKAPPAPSSATSAKAVPVKKSSPPSIGITAPVNLLPQTTEILSPAKVWSNAPKSLLVEGPKDKKRGIYSIPILDIKVESIPHKPEPSYSEVIASSLKTEQSFAKIQEKDKFAEVDAAVPSFNDLKKSFEDLKAKQLSIAKAEKTFFQQAVENSFMNIPDSVELDRNRRYYPRIPCGVPSYYPSKPPVVFDNPAIFERFDIDTLFFIFYYQQKTLQQYFAARELKKQSWRFHKKYLTWFQRHEEPKAITEDYEQGTYIYFDYEGSWCQRKKTEFTFEYRYLEDAELV